MNQQRIETIARLGLAFILGYAGGIFLKIMGWL
jgi:hypothetical protein